MNLLRFEFTYNPNYIFINSLDLSQFLNLFEIDSRIELIQFYGSNKDFQADENMFEKKLTIRQFLNQIDNLGDLKINNIVFKLNDLQVDIMDCMEYNISSATHNLPALLNKVLRELLFSNLRHNDLTKYEGKYLLFKNGEMIEIFSNFDEYIDYNNTEAD